MISPRCRIAKPLACAALLMRIQLMSRWPMCQMPSAPLIMWWIWRSRMGSKSDCILRPATSTQRPSGSAEPAATSAASGPTTSILPSSTSASSRVVTYSKAGVRLPPNST